ncbi:MAG: DNA adenine methylase [Gemmatimonadota bacterium]
MIPRRPVLRYHGGKWRIAPWIIRHFPAHHIYVEPFGGAASVLMRKDRAPKAEVYNDLDGDVVNVFRVLRDPKTAARLRAMCELTPFSRVEFFESYEPTDDPVERARRTIARTFMAHGSTHRRAHRTGFRARTWLNKASSAVTWTGWPAQVPAYVNRLRGVTIENRPALEVIAQQDSAETLFYVDPPYPLSTRTSVRCESESDGGRAYVHNLSDDDHRELLGVLREAEGMVVVSGYACALYDQVLSDWRRASKEVRADGGAARVEHLWIKPGTERLELFA